IPVNIDKSCSIWKTEKKAPVFTNPARLHALYVEAVGKLFHPRKGQQRMAAANQTGRLIDQQLVGQPGFNQGASQYGPRFNMNRVDFLPGQSFKQRIKAYTPVASGRHGPPAHIDRKSVV